METSTIPQSFKSWRQYGVGPFALGTAQLGLPYGIANQLGQPSTQQAHAILTKCWQAGIRLFDTAQDYGTSEAVLGQWLELQGFPEEALFVTKLSGKHFTDDESAILSLNRSLALLRCKKLFAVLAHSADVLKNVEHTSRIFRAMKDSGKVMFTGISVYSVDEATIALAAKDFDIIQMPLNALDRRPIAANLVRKALEQNKLLIFRSAFLQGLLLMEPEKELPPHLNFAESTIRSWQQNCLKHKLTPDIAAIQIANQLAGPFPLLIGVESIDQLESNLQSIKKPLPQLNELIRLTMPLADNCSERLLNPSLW